MDLREAIRKDIRDVFHNSGEFSGDMELWYNGMVYTVPSVVSEYIPAEFSGANSRRDGTGYGDGICQITQVAYIPYEALGFLPGINNRIDIDGVSYDILSSELIQGAEIVLKLRRYDE